MKNIHFRTNMFQCPLAFLLAMITVLSLTPGQLLIPAAAAGGGSAAPASLTNHYSDLSAGSGGNWYGSYQSSNLTPSTVNVRAIPVTLSDSTSTYAMCYDHALSIRTGAGFSYSASITDSSTAAGPFLAWFYFNVEAGNWSDWETNLTSGWVNVVLWLAQAGAFTNYNDEAQLALIAQERVKALAVGGGNVTAADSVTLFQQIIASFKSGTFGSWSFDIYNYSSGSYQPLLVGRGMPEATHTVYVKLQKTDGSSPLPGATFGVYRDSACTDKAAEFTSASSQWSTSGAIEIYSQTAILYVKELTAPSDYTLSRTVYSVSVDGTVHNTPGSAAAVFGGGAIENTTGKTPNAGSVLQKLDGSTGFGIGPATFEVEGNAEGGQYVSMAVTTDASGSVDLQWSDAESSSNYIAPGEYTVREIFAPSGYEMDPAGQHLSLWLEYDSELDEYLPRSSGPITFLNYPQHSITLKKVDERGNGLPGAVFDIYRNGTLLQSATTSSGGIITLNDVASGYYTFVETAAPAGYVTPTYGYTKGIYVDATDTSVSNHTITMTNYKYPDIVIEKYDSASNLPLAGAQFVVKIDGTTLGTFLTGSNGTIAITYAQYGAFLSGGNSSWTVTVTEVSPPNGYFDADTATQTNEIRQGQTLSPFVYRNRAYPNVEVYKLDAKTNLPLAGVEFTLEHVSGATAARVATTDSAGKAVFERVPLGTYTLSETAVPPGYLLSEKTHTIVVDATSDSVLQHEYKNDQKPSLLITKMSKNLAVNIPIAGVGFLVQKTDGETVGTYYTDASGKILLEHLDPGKYTITEISVPDGWVLDGTPRNVTLVPNETASVLFENLKEPSLTIRKVDTITGAPLGGVEFYIEYRLDGSGAYKGLGTYFTNASGLISLQNLDTGWYKVTEVAPPSGYQYHATDGSYKEFHLEGNEDYTVTFRNTPLSALVIRKIDSDTGLPVPGTTFQVRYLGEQSGTGGTVIYQGKTSINGSIVLTGLPAGTYIAEETIPADGYELSNPSVQTVYLTGKNQDVVELEFANAHKGALVIRKLDSVTKQPLAEATFKITDSSGGVIGPNNGEYTTDASGLIHIGEDLPIGSTIIVQETSAPEGYILDTSSQTVTIKENTLHTLTFYNTPKGSLIIEKCDSVTKQPLAGAQFRVTTSSGEFVAQAGGAISSNGLYTTDANGKIHITGLGPDTYVVTEISAPEGYNLDAPAQTVVVKANDTQTLTFYDSPKSGLAILKLDSVTGLPLKGAQFKVTYSDGGAVGSSSGIYTTDAEGFITVDESLKPGITIIVQETSAPEGYVLDTSSQTVTIKENTLHTLTFYNTPKGSLIIEKRDSVTKEPLAGAQFRVTTSSGEFVAQAGGAISSNGLYTTDANGKIHITGLGPDTYVVTEISAPEGYNLDAPAQTVVVKANDTQTLTFYDSPKSGLAILKLDSVTGLPLKGAQFKVTYSDGGAIGSSNGIYTTDAEGFITVDESLKPGITIIVQETSAPEGYILDTSSQTVTIKENTLHTLTFYNTPKGSLIIEKRDSVTRQPLAGAQFQVTTSSGEFVAQAGGAISSNGLYTTDANGKIHITGLGPDTYVVTEISAPEGYNLDAPAQTVVVKANDTQTLTFYDSPKSGLQIVKLDKDTKQPIKGAEFTLYKPSGAVIGTYTTDKDGLILIDNLAPGWIKVVETKAPDGYLLDDTPKDVEITSNQFLKLVFENMKLPGLQILKLDEETRRPIAGVEFRVAKMNGEIIGTYRTDSKGIIHLPEIGSGWYTATETKSAKGYMLDDTVHTIEVKDGKVAVLTVTNQKTSGILIHKVDAATGNGIPGVTFLLYDGNNNPLGQYESDQDGYVYIGDGLPEGKYKIRELKPAAGYNGDGQVRTVYLEYGRTTEIEWENSRELGQIIVTKRSAAFNETTNLPAGTPLSGSVFEVYTLAGNLADRMVSDSRGVAASAPLPVGVYLVKEVSPSPYYALNPREFLAEIRHDGDIVRFEVLNENTDLGVTIQKKSSHAASNGQALYYDLVGIANTSTVALESFYLHDRLPTDAVRGVTMFTGTWSHRLTYQVTYKTNYSADYRVLAAGLSTKTNYELSIHPNVLGLQSGEYVTDIRWEFGTVPAGFQSVTNPKIQAQVLATLPKGYKIINRADVGGLYIGQWITAQTSWTTLIYSDPAPAPELPKTGY